MTPNTRYLILNGDDLGMARSINRASFEALEKGWITSASAMVPAPYFEEVLEFARRGPRADIGLHFALTSESPHLRFKPLTGPKSARSLVDPEGYLLTDRSEFLRRADPLEVEAEIMAQIDHAKGAGLSPSHFDSHMEALEARADLKSILLRIASDLGIACRAVPHYRFSISPGTKTEMQAIGYLDALNRLHTGLNEFILHLGFDEPELHSMMDGRQDWGARWRQADYDLVRSALFREALKRSGARLISWFEFQQEFIPSKP